jgi:transcriptional regulator with XRE-family HTH domain
MYIYRMPRRALSEADRRHGRRLGQRIAQERSHAALTTQDLAVAARLSIDTVRSVESGRVPTPAFLTVARIAAALGISLDELHLAAQGKSVSGRAQRRGGS